MPGYGGGQGSTAVSILNHLFITVDFQKFMCYFATSSGFLTKKISFVIGCLRRRLFSGRRTMLAYDGRYTLLNLLPGGSPLWVSAPQDSVETGKRRTHHLKTRRLEHFVHRSALGRIVSSSDPPPHLRSGQDEHQRSSFARCSRRGSLMYPSPLGHFASPRGNGSGLPRVKGT